MASAGRPCPRDEVTDAGRPLTSTATPHRLRRGAHLRIVAPSRTLEVVGAANRSAAEQRLRGLGFSVSYAQHAFAAGQFGTAPTALRVQDLHDAYADPSVDGILTAIGGAGCIELLPHLDWQLLRTNPKPLCGYSDVTALINAIVQRAGTIAYCGPHFSSFAMPDPGQFQTSGFMTAMAETDFAVRPSSYWSDDAWYEKDASRCIQQSAGWVVLNEGTAEGPLIGGNLTTFGLLQGTSYSPPLAGSVLLAEDTAMVTAAQFRNRLAALALQPGSGDLQGLIIGRFQRGSGVSEVLLQQLLSSLPEIFRGIPVIANVESGHTQPIATLAIGANISLSVGPQSSIAFG